MDDGCCVVVDDDVGNDSWEVNCTQNRVQHDCYYYELLWWVVLCNQKTEMQIYFGIVLIDFINNNITILHCCLQTFSGLDGACTFSTYTHIMYYMYIYKVQIHKTNNWITDLLLWILWIELNRLLELTEWMNGSRGNNKFGLHSIGFCIPT